MMHVDIYAAYLKQAKPRTESRALPVFISTVVSRDESQRALCGYMKSYQVMLNLDGFNIYTKTYVTTDSEHVFQVHVGQEDLKVQ